MGRNTHGHEYTYTQELNTAIITNVYTMCIKKLLNKEKLDVGSD